MTGIRVHLEDPAPLHQLVAGEIRRAIADGEAARASGCRRLRILRLCSG
jgi:hypothetical protein